MAPIDLKRRFKELYTAERDPALVQVPDLSYLMIDGHGDPNVTPAYREAVEALFAVAYTIKFALKRGPQQVDYTVMPLEGLWWVPDMATFSVERKSEWDWTMMILQPDEVGQDLVTEAITTASEKKDVPAVAHMRLEHLAEGTAAHVMHVGPYADEGPTIERLHAFIGEEGLRLAGKHHEIYLSDARRAAPERMRTILRQPVTGP